MKFCILHDVLVANVSMLFSNSTWNFKYCKILKLRALYLQAKVRLSHSGRPARTRTASTSGWRRDATSATSTWRRPACTSAASTPAASAWRACKTRRRGSARRASRPTASSARNLCSWPTRTTSSTSRWRRRRRPRRPPQRPPAPPPARPPPSNRCRPSKPTKSDGAGVKWKSNRESRLNFIGQSSEWDTIKNCF